MTSISQATTCISQLFDDPCLSITPPNRRHLTSMADNQIPVDGSDSSLNNNGSAIPSPRSSTDSRSSTRNLRVSHMPAPNHQHRQSLSESLRGPPGSPRARRQPSLTQSAIQSLIDNPPPPKQSDPAFIGRDWREISIGELVSPDDLKFVELDTGIEDATNVSISMPAQSTLTNLIPRS